MVQVQGKRRVSGGLRGQSGPGHKVAHIIGCIDRLNFIEKRAEEYEDDDDRSFFKRLLEQKNWQIDQLVAENDALKAALFETGLSIDPAPVLPSFLH